MYIHCSLLFSALMISWLARASCLLNSSYNKLSGQRTHSCPSDGTPVCGLQGKQLVLFSNNCLLNAANKDIWPGETIFRKVPLRNCMQGCKFPCPKTYKPVCTRNKKTLRKHLFTNQCELLKHICKWNVEYFKISLDECLPKYKPKKYGKLLGKRAEEPKNRRRPIPCTNVFKPVCGSYMGVKSSFKNECILNAENVAFDRDWRIVKNGMCPEDLSKTRRRIYKPAKPHIIKKRSYNNILLNQHPQEGSLDTNVNNKLNAPPNDLYVYMPSTFQSEFLNHDSSDYQLYNKYLKKNGTLKQFEDTIERTDVLNFKESLIRPLPFSINRVHLNSMTNKNLAEKINRQTSFSGIEPTSNEIRKQIYYEFKTKEGTGMRNEYLDKTTTTVHTTTVRTISISNRKQIKREEISETKNECKLGTVAICASLANGTLRTFETLCDMKRVNAYLEKKWAKLHEGSCNDCKFNCTLDYEPVCISKNGVNYTMINKCYYNLGICQDKNSKWQFLSNKECDRYTSVHDRYPGSKPGLSYTSSCYVSETTEVTSANSTTQAPSKKRLKAKSSKNKIRKGNFKREVNRLHGADRCCSRSHLSELTSENTMKCKCWSDSTQKPPSLHAPETESYVMSLVQEKDK